MTPGIKRRGLAAARAPVERGVARLKSWRIFRRSRCIPNRMTSIARVVLTLEPVGAGGGQVVSPARPSDSASVPSSRTKSSASRRYTSATIACWSGAELAADHHLIGGCVRAHPVPLTGR